MKAWQFGVGALLAAAVVAGAMVALREPEVDCARMAPADYPPKCVAAAEQGAKAGDSAAMLRLAQHFEVRDPAAAAAWTRQAAQAGAPAAIQRIVANCGDGKPFSLAEAEALLPRLGAPDQAWFHLGGSCKPADAGFAAKLDATALMAGGDAAGLCRVAVLYGQLSISPAGAKLDGAAAGKLLAECVRRAAGSEAAQQAHSVQQMLARQIRPVRLE